MTIWEKLYECKLLIVNQKYHLLNILNIKPPILSTKYT